MKNQIIGFVTCVANLLLSSLAFGQAFSYTEVNFSGYDGPEYSYDSGVVQGPSSHDSGDLPGPSTVSGSTSASFGFGYVRVLASADDFTPIGDTSGLTATAFASYTDTIIPVAGPIGSLITITASWTLHGSDYSNLALNGTGVARTLIMACRRTMKGKPILNWVIIYLATHPANAPDFRPGHGLLASVFPRLFLRHHRIDF